jgi:hypothetical protein
VNKLFQGRRKLDPENYERLLGYISQHITLGVESIYAGVFRAADPENLSFTNVLNRIMAIAQIPILFIVLKQKNDKTFYQVYQSVQEEVLGEHRNTVQRRVKNVIQQKQKHGELLFQIWDTDYYLLCLAPYSNLENISERFQPITVISSAYEELEEKTNITIHNRIDAASYVIFYLLQRQKYQRYGIVDTLQRAIECLTDRESTKPNNPSQNIYNDETKSIRLMFEEGLLHKRINYDISGTSIIDKSFKEILKNIWSIQTKETQSIPSTITNFIFFARDYDDNQRDEFSYNIRILIGQEQEKEILRHMVWLVENKREDIVLQRNKLVNPKNTLSLSATIDYVWANMFHSTGRKNLLEILRSPYGKDAISLADQVFSGVSHLRFPFFNDGGLGRCCKHVLDLPLTMEEVENHPSKNDLVRTVLCHYLFESMATASGLDGAKNLTIMMNPVEVGGRIWGVLAYVTRSQKAKKTFTCQEDIDEYQKFWLQNYHMYHHVNERFIRKIRKSMKDFYGDLLASLYATRVVSLPQTDISKTSTNTKIINSEIGKLNDAYRYLTRLFPYDGISLSNIKEANVEYALLNDEHPYRVLYCKEFYFDIILNKEVLFQFGHFHNGRNSFLNITDIAIKLTTAVDWMLYQKANKVVYHTHQPIQ